MFHSQAIEIWQCVSVLPELSSLGNGKLRHIEVSIGTVITTD